MKYLVISLYDSGCEYSCCVNGHVYTRNSKTPHYISRLLLNAAYSTYDDFEEDFKKSKLYKKFDLIVVCNNGETKVLKQLDYIKMSK